MIILKATSLLEIYKKDTSITSRFIQKLVMMQIWVKNHPYPTR
jgi:hypothetical protein